MTARGRDKRHGERGQILAMMVISLMALCALAGLAADMGFFSDYRRRMQTAADAAAMAGAEHVRRERLQARVPSLTDVQSQGYNASTSNGFTNDVDSTHVTVSWPPGSGPYANDGFVEAIITQPRPTIFMNILGFQSATVRARAVAGRQDLDNCIYQLNKTAYKGLNLNGGAQVNANCGIVVDSSDPDALDESGGSCVQKATSITVTGSNPGYSGTCFTPAPTTNVPPAPDPFGGLDIPSLSSTISTCDYTRNPPGCSPPSCIQSSTPCSPPWCAGGTWTLQPGVYCGGIKITGGNVTFASGVYVLNGGGLDINGGTLNGTSVIFYNTAHSTATYTASYGAVSIQGTATGKLSAPTSGEWKAMLFFQDRTVSANGSSLNNTINGGATLCLQGALYFPLPGNGGNSSLTLTGSNSSTCGYTIIVADTIKLSGIFFFNDDFAAAGLSGWPIDTVALAE